MGFAGRKRKSLWHGSRSRKDNNQGFSLIEVMLAMTILVIIAVPFMNYFVMSTKENVISADIQGATIAAQTVMEEIKTKTVREIWESGGYIVVDSAGTPVAAGPDFVRKDAEPYYFLKKNISFGGTSYDALITLDHVTSAEMQAVNAVPIPKLQEVNGTNRVMIYQSDQDEIAALYFSNRQIEACNAPGAVLPPDVPETEDEIKGKLWKEMRVTLEESALYPDKVSILAEFCYRPIVDASGASTIWGCDESLEYVLSVNADVMIMDKPLEGKNVAVYLFYNALPGCKGIVGGSYMAADSLNAAISWNGSGHGHDNVDFYLTAQEDAAGAAEPYPAGYKVETAFVCDTLGAKALHSNVSTTAEALPRLIGEASQQRFFQAGVKLYKSGDTYTADHIQASYDSTKGVWNYEE